MKPWVSSACECSFSNKASVIRYEVDMVSNFLINDIVQDSVSLIYSTRSAGRKHRTSMLPGYSCFDSVERCCSLRKDDIGSRITGRGGWT